ncbi:hypothetical protein PMAYCL1PPCAC_11092, partial [Pristionchus mayeri]
MDVLTELLVSDPVVEPVALSPPGSKKATVGRREESEAISTEPAKIFTADELHGMKVWTRDSYEEEYAIPKTPAADAVEKVVGRDVERIVGFVTHPV